MQETPATPPWKEQDQSPRRRDVSFNGMLTLRRQMTPREPPKQPKPLRTKWLISWPRTINPWATGCDKTMMSERLELVEWSRHLLSKKNKTGSQEQGLGKSCEATRRPLMAIDDHSMWTWSTRTKKSDRTLSPRSHPSSTLASYALKELERTLGYGKPSIGISPTRKNPKQPPP